MALEDPEYFSQSGVAENRLVGGSGNDILRGEVVESLADGLDRGLLNGGSGADQLRVIGGDGNQLDTRNNPVPGAEFDVLAA